MPNRRRPAPPLGAAPITVAIATYQRAPLLRRALESCRDQTVKPEKVIVVDDGSTDDTAEVVRAFEGLAIEYHYAAGRIGIGAARNLATDRCTTPFLCILDDDDIMLPWRLADHCVGLTEGAALSHGGWVNFNALGEFDFHPGKPVDEDVILYVGNAITHDCCAYETEVLRRFPYRSDVVAGEDFDLAVRAVRSGIRCRHTGSYVLLRRRHSTNVSVSARDVLLATRRSVVTAIDADRSPEEIARRTAAGRAVAELPVAPPPLEELYRLIDIAPVSLRAMAWAPRAATPLFEVLDRLRRDGHTVDLFDPEPGLSSRLVLAGAPSRDGATLLRLHDALRGVGFRSYLRAAEAPVFASLPQPRQESDEPGTFRVAVCSDLLRELELAHRILAGQKRWKWLLAVGAGPASPDRPIYSLVSEPLSGSAPGASRDDVVRFIFDQTDLAPHVHDAADPDATRERTLRHCDGSCSRLPMPLQ